MSNLNILKILEKTIDWSFYLLIFWIPLPLGSARPWTTLIAQILIFLIALLWLLKILINGSYDLSFSWMHLLIFLFILLLALQLLPLPPKILHILSPKTYWLYAEMVAGYDGKHPEIRDLEKKYFSIDPLDDGPWQWKSISINSFKTKEMLLKMISFFLIFLIAIEHFKSPNKADRLINVLLIIGTFEAFYGMLEYLSGHQHILFFKKKYNLEVATGTFVNPNHFAGFLEMILPIAIGMFFYKHRQSESEFGTWKEKILSLSNPSKLKNFLIFFAIAINLSALFLSYSRSGIIVCLISLIFLFASIVLSYRKGKVKLALIILLLLLLVLPVIGFGFQKIKQKFLSAGDDFSMKGSRMSVWSDSMDIFFDFPLFGSGLGTFEDCFSIYSSQHIGIHYDFAHNDYIQILVETGITGFSLVLFTMSFIFFMAYKHIKKRKDERRAVFLGLIASFIAILIHEFTDFNLYIYSNALLFSIVIALIFIEAKRKEAQERNSQTLINVIALHH